MTKPVYDTIWNDDRAYVFVLKQFARARTSSFFHVPDPKAKPAVAVPRTTAQKGICLVRDDVVQAAVLYDWFTGSNCFMHVAALPGRRWLNRDFLHWTFHYPFCQAHLNRVSGWVDANNIEARRFNEHLGFKLEATLEGAGQSGVDACIYTMKREDCRYV